MVHADSPAAPPAPVPVPTDHLDDTILKALENAGNDGLVRASLRAAVRVRNQRLGEALTRLAATGQVTRRGHRLVRVPRPQLLDTQRNGNGNSPIPPS